VRFALRWTPIPSGERVEAQTKALLAVVKSAELRAARRATQQELASLSNGGRG
jgi:hypothetical protein